MKSGIKSVKLVRFAPFYGSSSSSSSSINSSSSSYSIKIVCVCKVSINPSAFPQQSDRFTIFDHLSQNICFYPSPLLVYYYYYYYYYHCYLYCYHNCFYYYYFYCYHIYFYFYHTRGFKFYCSESKDETMCANSRHKVLGIIDGQYISQHVEMTPTSALFDDIVPVLL